jgi:hypothetical protein
LHATELPQAGSVAHKKTEGPFNFVRSFRSLRNFLMKAEGAVRITGSHRRPPLLLSILTSGRELTSLPHYFFFFVAFFFVAFFFVAFFTVFFFATFFFAAGFFATFFFAAFFFAII